MKRLAFGLVAAFALGASALAQEFQPYPTPKITVQQWVGYLALIKSRLETTEQAFPELQLIVFTDYATRTQYTFTASGHPAHPAWIARQVVDENGKVNVRQIGYFAGSEEQFDVLFRTYLKLHAQMQQDSDKRR
ncbi:MAG: hypothetical protein ACRES3_07955 [Steroidobacteraceae bacterium]